LNGVRVEWNQQAFEWGRQMAHAPETVTDLIDRTNPGDQLLSDDELIEKYAEELVAYQDRAYSDRFRSLVGKVKTAETKNAPGMKGLTEAVARYAYKLMAYKDEYEVGRLYSDSEFKRKLADTFEGDFKLEFNLSPPSIAPKDKVSGLPKKMTFGSWMLPAFNILAKLRFLRGTVFDPFGRTEERRAERNAIDNYEKTVEELIGSLHADNHALAVQIASIPEQIRGYGYVKEEHLQSARACEADLLNAWRAGTTEREAA